MTRTGRRRLFLAGFLVAVGGLRLAAYAGTPTWLVVAGALALLAVLVAAMVAQWRRVRPRRG
jgi:hypothetical protein